MCRPLLLRSLLAVFLISATWLPGTSGTGIAAADESPLADAPLKDLEGETVRIGDWSGRLRLVNFWATWCAPCRAEMPMFQKAYEQHRNADFVILGVALDSVDAVSSFQRQLGITYPLLIVDTQAGLDLMRKSGNRPGVVPFSVLLSADGEVLDKHLGPYSEVQLYELLEQHLDRTPGTRMTRADPGGG